MNDSISAQVAALPGLPMKDLWALWDAHFPRRPAHTNRHYVESRLAYRLQEQAYGPLPAGVRRYLVERGAQFSKIQQAGRGTECHLMPGTVLLREWDEREYRVTVTADGLYELNGTTLQEPVGGGAPHHRHATGRGRCSSGSKRAREVDDEHCHPGLTQALCCLLPRVHRRTPRPVVQLHRRAEGSRPRLHREPAHRGLDSRWRTTTMTAGSPAATWSGPR